MNVATQTEEDLDTAIQLIRETQGSEATLDAARMEVRAAKTALSALEASPYRTALADIADFCVDRAF